MIERLRFDSTPERLPPQNTDAEVAVLGSCLLDRDVVGRLAGVLEPRDFYREQHGAIFRAMLDLYERHEPVDHLTLVEELSKRQRLEEVGGFVYLASLIEAIPTPLHADHYAKLVADAAFMRRLISAGGKIATLGYTNDLPPERALERAEQVLFEVPSARSDRDFYRIDTVLREYLDELEALHRTEQAEEMVAASVPSGFLDLDRLLAGGFQRSDLVILAARPSVGKSALAFGFVVNLATTFQGAVAIFSLEMSRVQVIARMLSTEAGIETTRLRTGQLTDKETRQLGQAFGTLAETKIYIDDTPGISVMNLRAKARRLHNQVPLDLLVVDHLQLMTGSRSGDNRTRELDEITAQLKGLARELHVPIVALSQLNRSVEQRANKTPNLSDLRESGGLEQNADVVIFIYRDDYHEKDSERQGIADLIVAKHRNGPTGTISLLFNQRTTKFLDLQVYRD